MSEEHYPEQPPVDSSDEPPPVLAAWWHLYMLVLAHLAFWIAIFYLFTIRFDRP